jgi:class 3 adenylate cyclase/predicted ATPase
MVDLKHWLEELSLGQYAHSFAENDIDFDVLPDLTERDLERLGLSLGHRKRLLHAIAALERSKVGQSSPSMPAPIPAAMPAVESGAERRHITVMFCDLVGSTEMSARLDPEDLRDTFRTYQQACAEVIDRFGGFIAQYLGDGILAYFGYPRTHEGEAERAVRAGLATLGAIAGISADAGAELRVRIGIATGPAVVGDLIGRGAVAQISVTGKTPNLASRVQELARPGTLVITDSTRRLVAGQFECECLGAMRLKGIDETVQVWQVLRELSDAERFEAKRASQIACVGRDREMTLLFDRWRLALAGTGQAVVVSGDAGIGKSRLAALLREQLPTNAYFNLRLQCAQHHRNSPLYPLIVHLRRAAGFKSEDEPAAKLKKIEQLLAMAGSSSGAPLVAALLSVPLDGCNPPLAMSPARQREATLELLIDQVLGLAARQPVLLVVEDAHWLDPTTEETLIRLLDRLNRHRILMLLTTRPDYPSRLADHPQVMTIMLGRLGQDEAEQMISEVIGGKALPPEVMEQLLVKTDGVPLFIEELTKTVLESGLRRQNGESYRLNRALPPLSIPSTLEESLRARLDHLSSVKYVAQVGAAISRTFSYAIIAAVMSEDDNLLRSALDRLVEAKLIYQHGAPPDAFYTFKHALVQDAAYESLLRSRRVSLHARIVDAIEIRFPEIAETEPELLAHHCSRAELAEKAIGYWLKAGVRAVSRSANLEAITHLDNGLKLLHAIGSAYDRERLELELQLTLGQASIAARGYTATETTHAFARAEQLVERIGDAQQHYSALYGIFVGHLIGGRIDIAGETVGRLQQLANRGGDDAYLCLAYRLHGSLSFFRGDLAVAHEELQKAVRLYGPERQRQLALHFGPDTGLAAQIFLAMTEWLRGRPESALQMAQSAIASARRLDHALTLGQVLTLATQLHCMSQDYDSMIHLGKEGCDCCERESIIYFGAICRLYQIWAQACRSNPADYIGEFRLRFAAYEDLNCGLQLGLFHSMLAQLLLAADAPADAAKEAETALAKIAVNGERWWMPDVYRVLGNSLLALPNPDANQAEDCFRRAMTEARATGALMLELRAATNLAQLLSRCGDEAEARQTLAPIFAQFSEGFGTADLRAARAFLDGKPQLALL